MSTCTVNSQTQSRSHTKTSLKIKAAHAKQPFQPPYPRTTRAKLSHAPQTFNAPYHHGLAPLRTERGLERSCVTRFRLLYAVFTTGVCSGQSPDEATVSLLPPPFQHPPRAYHTTPLFTHRPPLTEHTQHSKREKRQRTSAPPRLATFLLQSRCLTDEVVPSVPTKSRRL